jgi:Spy/CpxP family protein refolding chaperone
MKMMTAVLFMLAFMAANTAIAQPGSGYGKQRLDEKNCNRAYYNHSLPNLSEDQQTKIEKLHDQHFKSMQAIRDQMAEKKARLNTLNHADKPDMDAINKVIEDIGQLKVQMMKKKITHRLEIRNLLTDEQKIVFDKQPMGKMHKKHFRSGKQGRGNQNCPYNNQN